MLALAVTKLLSPCKTLPLAGDHVGLLRKFDVSLRKKGTPTMGKVYSVTGILDAMLSAVFYYL